MLALVREAVRGGEAFLVHVVSASGETSRSVSAWDALDAAVKSLPEAASDDELRVDVASVRSVTDPWARKLHPRDAFLASAQALSTSTASQQAILHAAVCAAASEELGTGPRVPQAGMITASITSLKDAFVGRTRPSSEQCMSDVRAWRSRWAFLCAELVLQAVTSLRTHVDTQPVRDEAERALLEVGAACVMLCECPLVCVCGAASVGATVLRAVLSLERCVSVCVSALVRLVARRLAGAGRSDEGGILTTREQPHVQRINTSDVHASAPWLHFSRIVFHGVCVHTCEDVMLPRVASHEENATWLSALATTLLQAACVDVVTRNTVGFSEGDAMEQDAASSSRVRVDRELGVVLDCLSAHLSASPPNSRCFIVADDADVAGHDATPPLEVQLCMACVSLCAQASDVRHRNAALAVFRSYVRSMTPPCRLLTCRLLLGNCPFPQLAGLILDEVRRHATDVLRPGAAAAVEPAHLRRIGEIIMECIAARGRVGFGVRIGTELSAADIRNAAVLLDANAQQDTGILALTRFVLLCVRRDRTSGATSAPSFSVLTDQQLCEIRDMYLQPLLFAVAACQRQLREDAGIMALHSHPHPFTPSAANPATAHAHADEHHDHAPARIVAVGAPEEDVNAAVLSTLFLLDAAAVPVMELLRDITSPHAAAVSSS